MEMANSTSWAEFILVGFLSHMKTPSIILAPLIFLFLAILSENSFLLYVIQVNLSLHLPMYFFLSQLSLMDICQTLAIGPKMIADFIMRQNIVSLIGCSAQMCVTLMMGIAECYILAVMSYDRYVAICKPLQYPILMRRNIQLTLTAGVWLGAFLQAFVPGVYVLLLQYCGSNVIQHFFCDLPSIIKLSCSDTTVFERIGIIISVQMLLFPLLIILVSYSYILGTVLRSVGRSNKAFSTCFSHLAVVILFYGAAMLKYLRPRSYRTPYQDDVVSVFCTIVTPMLNPLIYSLRNQDVLAAFKKLFCKYTVIK